MMRIAVILAAVCGLCSPTIVLQLYVLEGIKEDQLGLGA